MSMCSRCIFKFEYVVCLDGICYGVAGGVNYKYMAWGLSFMVSGM